MIPRQVLEGGEKKAHVSDTKINFGGGRKRAHISDTETNFGGEKKSAA